MKTQQINSLKNYIYPLLSLFLLIPLHRLVGQVKSPSLVIADTVITYTGDDTYYLLPKDSIFLNVGILSEKIFQHKLAPGQTLFSLANFYGLTLTELYFYNPELKNNAYNIGHPIKIPIPNRAIKRYKGTYFEESQYVPICYVVKKGDNLYHISKRIFKLPVDTVKQKNQLIDNTLHIGQVLDVGWMSIYGIPDSLRQFSGHPLWKQSFANKRAYFYKKEYTKEYKRQGPALWIKDAADKSTIVVMHRKAAEGSIIAVTNPMNNRTVYAKVAGKIPYTFPADIEAIVSPTIAKMLGVIDEKFYIKTSYLR